MASARVGENRNECKANRGIITLALMHTDLTCLCTRGVCLRG